MNKSWIFEDYAAALVRFEDAMRAPAATDLVKAGCIQYFEFCFELAWKAIKAATGELGLPPCQSPKACLSVAFTQGWIDNELTWLRMLEARNRMSHTYSSVRALEVYGSLAGFVPALRSLLDRLQALE